MSASLLFLFLVYVAVIDEIPPLSNEVILYSFLLALVGTISGFANVYSKLPPPKGLPLSSSSKDATWGLGISKKFCKNFPQKRTQTTFLCTINNVLPGYT